MKEIVTYALGVTVCSGIFVLFYRTVLHRHIPFPAARIYLVASLALAAIIPALDIPVWRVAPVEIPITGYTTGTPVTPVAAAVPLDWPKIALWTLWTVGIAVLTVAMARQFRKISRIKRRAEIFRTGECEIALSAEVDSPFSFLETVFVVKGTSDRELRQIVLHEASHIRHRHSYEKIAMEALKNLLWFNPFAWWAASLLGEVHEFEADRDVLDGGSTVEEYLPLIFRQIFGYIPELSVGLGDSLTKKRFMMMKNKMKLTRYSSLRVAGVLPLVAGMILLFSCKDRAPEVIYTEEEATIEAVEMNKAAEEIPAEPAEINVEDIPLYKAEQMPKFQGGDLNDFRNWTQMRLVYPKEAIEKNISGRVTLKFVIERDGSLTNIEELSSPSKLLTDEAVRVLKESPKWSPGIQNGKPVRVFYILPVDYALKTYEAKPTAEQKPGDVGELSVRNTARILAESDPAITVRSQSVTAGAPIIFLDDKEITNEQLKAIDPGTIESISVLKGSSAIEKYGPRAKNGVILIKSKKDGDKGDTVAIVAGKETEMGDIFRNKELLRESGVLKITYAVNG